jgi:hypothetical protein
MQWISHNYRIGQDVDCNENEIKIFNCFVSNADSNPMTDAKLKAYEGKADYSHGIERLVGKIGYSLCKDATPLINRMVNNLIGTLVNSLAEEAHVQIEHLEKVLRKTFPVELATQLDTATKAVVKEKKEDDENLEEGSKSRDASYNVIRMVEVFRILPNCKNYAETYFMTLIDNVVRGFIVQVVSTHSVLKKGTITAEMIVKTPQGSYDVIKHVVTAQPTQMGDDKLPLPKPKTLG